MKRKLKIIWCVAAPLVLIGGLIYFLLDISWMSFLIWLGMCIVINLPMCFLAFIEDATGSGRIVTLLFLIFLAPIFLIICWFYDVKGLRRGGSGRGSRTYSSPSYDDDEDEVAVDNRKTDKSLLFNAMHKAVGRAIDSVKNSGIYGYYGKISNWNIEHSATHMFGIRIYGSVTYRIDKYSPNYSENDYRDDFNGVLETLKEELESAVEREMERVQSEYKGFDDEWNLSINIQGQLKMN